MQASRVGLQSTAHQPNRLLAAHRECCERPTLPLPCVIHLHHPALSAHTEHQTLQVKASGLTRVQNYDRLHPQIARPQASTSTCAEMLEHAGVSVASQPLLCKTAPAHHMPLWVGLAPAAWPGRQARADPTAGPAGVGKYYQEMLVTQALNHASVAPVCPRLQTASSQPWGGHTT